MILCCSLFKIILPIYNEAIVQMILSEAKCLLID